MGGKTKLKPKLMHLEPERAEEFEQLAKSLGRKQSELMREAIDMLLEAYRKPRKKRGSKP